MRFGTDIIEEFSGKFNSFVEGRYNESRLLLDWHLTNHAQLKLKKEQHQYNEL